MNKIYKSIWNECTNSWVAVAEIGKACGKKSKSALISLGTISIIFLSPTAYAASCVNGSDGSYYPKQGVAAGANQACDSITFKDNTLRDANTGIINQALPSIYGGFFLINYNATRSILNATDNFDVSAIAPSGGFGGIGNQYNANTMNFNNGTITYTAAGNSSGIGASAGATINFKNLAINAKTTAGSEVYGLLAGSAVIAGEGASTNGLYSTINVNNFTLVQTSPKSYNNSFGKATPVLNSGLRAIQGAYQNSGLGSSGKIVINGTLDMSLNGSRIEGIYVSGAYKDTKGAETSSQVILNGDSKIVLDNGGKYMTGNYSSALKIGKSRDVGTGKGYMESHGSMVIDASKAVGDAIKLAVTDSTLNANYSTSSSNILANNSIISVGLDDYGTSVDSNNISVALGNAKLRTASTTAPLLLIDGGQQNVKFLFDNKSDLAAAADGYLLDIVNARQAKTGTSATLNLDHGSSMSGLINNSYAAAIQSAAPAPVPATSTINVTLDNQSIWNLVAKQTGAATQTSTIDGLTLNNGSTLNAVNASGNANFILNMNKGTVSSSASTINLANGKAGDNLTINGNYLGLAGSKLTVDGTWNNPNSLTTDTLQINGNASGATAVSVPGGLLGDVTRDQQAKISNVPVVLVSQAHTDTVFTGTAPTTNAGEAQLIKQGNNYYWTLEAAPPPPDPKTVEPPAPTPTPPSPAPNPPAPTPPAPIPPAPTPPAPTPAPPPPTTVPIISQPVPGYLQTQQANLEMGLSQMGKLHERVGEQQTWAWDDCGTRCDQYQKAKADGKGPTPVWGRLNADYLKLQGDDRYGFKSNTGFAQFGADVNVSRNADDQSRRHTGVMFSYGWGSNNFYDNGRAVNGYISPDKYTGKSSTDMLSLGGYSTWYANNGTYVDLVGQLSALHNKFSSRDGTGASQNGWGVGLSAEVGRPWRIGDSAWQIEPQAQLSYQTVRLNGFYDGIRQVDGMNNDALRARLGGRLAWNGRYADQLRTKTFYLTANVLHDLSGSNPSVNVGRDTISESFGKTWGEVGAGAQWAFNKATYLFVDVRYQRSLDGNQGALGGLQREGYNGRIGVRHTW